MGKEHQDTSKKAAHWLELKNAWDQWQKGEPMPALSPEAQNYFESLSFAIFNDLLDQRGTCFEEVPRMRSGAEAWAQVFQSLVARRPRARLRVLDDIFLKARQKARETPGISRWDELEQQIGWILNQFEMRVRDAVRAYAREYGTAGLQRVKDSIDKPVPGSGNGSDERTLLDVLESADDDWGTELERREIQSLGVQVADAYFPGVRPAFKLSLFLRALRRRRSVVISVADPVVLAVAGVKKAVFAQGAVDSLEGLANHVATQPACKELDLSGRYYFCLQATLALLDRTEIWVWVGKCVNEMLETNASQKDPGRINPSELVQRLEAFAGLLRERLLEAGALLSENEMAPLFQVIEAARLQYCR
jgi:hypothetical protein